MKTVLKSDLTLYVRIEYSEPVELSDFTKSMQGLSDDFKLRQSSNPSEPTKLYICELQKGSIVAILAPLLPLAGELLGNFDLVESYAQYFKKATDWLLGKDGKPEKMTQHQLNNISKILEPVVNDKGAQLNIGTINNLDGGQINITQTINHADAQSIRNEIRQEIEEIKLIAMQELEDKMSGKHENVLMYWAQVAPNKTTDQAVIESIWPNPVKIIMPNEIKKGIALDEAFPFSKAFLVDVIVETINGKPRLYKVTKYHEAIDKD